MPRYLWGDEPFDLKWLPICFLFGALVNAFALELARKSPADDDYRGIVGVTLAWIWGYYNNISAQIYVKMKGKENGLDEESQLLAMRVAERSLYNTLEQGVPFLIMLWLVALFIHRGPSVALHLGWAYVVPRTLYAFAYSFHGHFSMWCELITQPNYQTLFYFKTSLLFYTLNLGFLEDYWPREVTTSFFMSFAFFLIGGIVDQILCWSWPVGYPAGSTNVKANLHDMRSRQKRGA